MTGGATLTGDSTSKSGLEAIKPCGLLAEADHTDQGGQVLRNESRGVVVIGKLDLSSHDTAAACERASKLAELIAPKLP